VPSLHENKAAFTVEADPRNTDCLNNPSDYNQEYTINLLWVNQVKSTTTVFPLTRDVFIRRELITHNHLQNLVNWATLHPKSDIFVWYDNATEQAVQETESLLTENKLNNVTLKNIETLTALAPSYAFLSDPKVPVYYKVDLYKLMLTTEMLNNDVNKTLVFSDFDLPALNKENLFDADTISKLTSFNLVFTQDGHLGFENSFHIMRHDRDLISSLNLIVHHATEIAKAFLVHPKANLRLFDPQLIYDFLGQNFFQIYYTRKGWITDDERKCDWSDTAIRQKTMYSRSAVAADKGRHYGLVTFTPATHRASEYSFKNKDLESIFPANDEDRVNLPVPGKKIDHTPSLQYY